MKNILTLAFFSVAVMAACTNSEKKSSESARPDAGKLQSAPDSTKRYSCPMHPEETGKKGEQCSKCGMELNKEVAGG